MTAPEDPGTERAARALPSLRASLNRLAIAANDSTRGARFLPDDHFAFMALTFHAKQLEHAEGLMILNGHPDVALIVRSMLEGWWQLKWAHGDTQLRAEKWRAFSIIHDWRAMHDAQAAGIEVSAARVEHTERRLASVRDQFLTARARQALSQNAPPPSDPFQSTWHGLQIRRLVEDIGELNLYAGPYDEFSDRHHWAPAGLAQGIQLDGMTYRYDARNARRTAIALTIAFHCLYESSMLLNEHLQLGFGDRLRALAVRYRADDDVICSGGTPQLDPALGSA